MQLMVSLGPLDNPVRLYGLCSESWQMLVEFWSVALEAEIGPLLHCHLANLFIFFFSSPAPLIHVTLLSLESI